jgi:hydrogenase/urease accessory protein HupE
MLRLSCLALAAVALLPMTAFGHNISESNASFVEQLNGPAVVPFLYLGAKHMFTGYDHVLFLVGVVFFLAKPRDVVLYVSLFTIGHSITLLGGVLAGWQVNAYLVDAVIGLSVVYKAFENMGGFDRLPFRIDSRIAVTVFGLFHGLGLATRLQDLTLTEEGLVTNLLSFNAGVELGQIAALAVVLLLLLRWRESARFEGQAFAANWLLMTCGFLLTGMQLAGYFMTQGVA